MMRALFRVDASPTIGGGHVMRCLALANVLSEKGWECSFVIAPETATSVPALPNSRHSMIAASQPEHVHGIIRSACPQVVIVDHYRLGFEFEVEASRHAGRLMVIDDLADRRHHCDLLLDPTLGRKEEEYEELVPQKCNLMLGPKFALLRQDFARARLELRDARAAPSREHTIVVCLGNSDPHDMTTVALRAIEATRLPTRVEVLLGSASGNAQSVRKQVERIGSRFRLHLDCDRVHELMAAADFAIGSCGTLSWERCALGLPAIGIVTADNQRRIASALTEAGAILYAGDWAGVDPETLSDLVRQLSLDPAKRREMAMIASTICDGSGAERVADLLGAAVA